MSNTLNTIQILENIDRASNFDTDNICEHLVPLLKQRKVIAQKMKSTKQHLMSYIVLVEQYDYLNDSIKRMLSL